MNKITTIGIDLAKSVFFLIELDPQGKQLMRKRLRRSQLLAFISNHPQCHIAMEACSGAHYWAREFRRLGHSIKLLPAQHIKGYMRGQKNDYNDALAIAEASQHGRIREVPVKTVEQQDEQAFHRIRRQLVSSRTRLINQTRGLAAEYGVVLPKGEAVFRQALPEMLGNEGAQFSQRFLSLLKRQHERLLALNEEVAWYDKELQQQAKSDPVCIKLMKIPAFGPVVAGAFKGWIGDAKQFKCGRDASAALGVVPRQYSTGGNDRLLGITKRGDKYVRTQLVHGARSVVSQAARKTDPLSSWINNLVARRGFNKAVLALVNKLIRVAWAIIARDDDYQPRLC